MKALSVFLLIAGTVFQCANQIQADIPHGHLKLRGGNAFTIARPAEIGFEMKDEQITGKAVSKNIMGFETKDQGMNLFQVIQGVDPGELDDLAKIAAMRAVEEAKADGIFITRVKEDCRWYVFTQDRTVTVYGKPLYFRSYGIVSPQRADQTLQDLKTDYEFKLNKELDNK